jgi:hypothetical protein
VNKRIKDNTIKSSKSRNRSLNQSEINSSGKSISSPVDQILSLQKTVGNKVVQRMFKSGTLQAKLKIGQTGDRHEREADRVAEQIMRMGEPAIYPNPEPEETLQQEALAEQITPLAQRQVDPEEEKEKEEELLQLKEISSHNPEVSPDLSSHLQSIKGGGQPLPESTRTVLERRFGHDFSQVRVHTDNRAAEAARGLNAQAFTVSSDISFGAAKYTPETKHGTKLLAHELTHVVQQSGHYENTYHYISRKESEFSEEVAGTPEKAPGLPRTVEKYAPFIVAGTSTMLDIILAYLRNPFVLRSLKIIHPDIYHLVNSLEKNLKPFLRTIEDAVNNPQKIIEALKAAIGHKISYDVEPMAKKYLSPVGEHFESVWHHFKERLQYLKENWWPIFKEVGWSVIWPIPNTIKDVLIIFGHLKAAQKSMWSGNFRNGTEELLNAWRHGNALIGRYYGWLFIASVLIGGIIGLPAAGFGAFAGAAAGAAIATQIGMALLISAIAAETAMILKSMSR